MKAKLSRRAALRGALGVSIGLPWLEAFDAKPARGATEGRRRFVTFFQGGGNLRERWRPQGTESDFELGELLAPLERHRSQLVVVDGTAMRCTEKGPGDNHMKGMGACTTGYYLLGGDVQGSGGGAAGLAAGPSVDQVIAEHIGQDTAFRSLQLGVYSLLGFGPGDRGGAWNYATYAAANQPLAPEDDPKALFARLFKDSPSAQGPDPELERLRAERRSINDLVMESYSALLPRVSRSDRARLDEHLSQLRELEKSLSAIDSPACQAPEAPQVTFDDRSQFPQILDVQISLLVMALACDRTRVASLQCGRGASTQPYAWLGLGGDHHGYQHADDGSAGAEGQAKICLWYAEQFATLLDRMAAVREGDASLLDNSLLFWTNDLGRGNNHALSDMPFLLAGKAGGGLRTGRYLSYSGNPHNQLLASCLRAMGIASEGFGDPDFPGALPGLV